MSSKGHSENSENTCVVCFKNVLYYSIGECDHPVCYECSTRMRVLCCQNECPICRQDMPKVMFTNEVRPFRELKGTQYFERKYNIYFGNQEIQNAYNKLLEHVCVKCPDKPVFKTFQNLKDHMRREHELFYCDLCVDNLKIFTVERRCYTRQELALHRRKGDPDDKSHKGHPLCEFCDRRYMDNDELFRHLRRDHLFCHFCDADGYHQYYSSYDFLRDHFRSEHFLCEEGSCAEEKFTSVFRTEIDLKAHRASVHGRTMGKAAAKQARTLELEFTLAPRPHEAMRGRRRGTRPREDDQPGAVCGDFDDQLRNMPTFFQPHINTDCIEEFPSLSGSGPTTVVRPNNSGVTIRTIRQSQPPLAMTEENFPVLGSDGTSCKTVHLSVNSTGRNNVESDLGSNWSEERNRMVSAKGPTNLSIHVNHRKNGSVTTKLSSNQNYALRPSISLKNNEDFPSLSGQRSKLSTTQWFGATSGPSGSKLLQGHQQPTTSKKVLPIPPPQSDFPILNSKFMSKCNITNQSSELSKAENKSSKKATTLTIPVSSSWSPPESSVPSSSTDVTVKSNDDCTSISSNLGSIKVKSKKKKPKQSNTSIVNMKEVPPNSKLTSSSNDIQKKKKKQTSQEIGEKALNTKPKGPTQDINYNNYSSVENNNNSSDSDLLPKEKKVVERKRSELLIASLSASENRDTSEKVDIDLSDENFPTLGKHISKPPGFFGGAAPPGFSNNSGSMAPPPGFSVTLNSVARPQSNGLTFTSSSGQSYSILPSYQYTPPADLDKRNQVLVKKVTEAVDNLDEFLQFSALFRQDTLSAESFYIHCANSIEPGAFKEIFPELLALLPDIKKQQELLKAHQVVTEDKKGFEVCATCGQVLRESDLRYHVNTHRLESHFPVLQPSVNMTEMWGKSK